MSGWQPIETAPKDGTAILAIIPGFLPSIVQWVSYEDKAQWFIDPEHFHEEEHFASAFLDSSYRPRYWMPLPESPK